ncbi:hypothetical protein HDU82_006166 [Entophlyctis luteolus]|nr:hypothetical protein HDU82_006166 [Entophlyctis luteolus]
MSGQATTPPAPAASTPAPATAAPAAHKDLSENTASVSSPTSAKRVYVSNLSFRTTDADLTAAFGAVCPGQVRKATVIKKFGRSKGFGFVTFISNEAAQTAVAHMDRVDVGGRTINVRIAIQTTRGKNSTDLSAAPAPRKKQFSSKKSDNSAGAPEPQSPAANNSPQSPEVNSASSAPINPSSVAAEAQSGAESDTLQSSTKKPRKRFNKKKQQRPPVNVPPGNGSVDLEHQRIDDAGNEEDAAVAAENSDAPANVVVNGDFEKQQHQRQRRPLRQKKRPQGPLSKSTLFVSNLPYAIDDQALFNLFSDYGSIEAKVIQRNGQSKGFGFVKLRDETLHQNAMEAFRTETFQVDGRLLVVRAAIDSQRTGYDTAVTSDSQ